MTNEKRVIAKKEVLQKVISNAFWMVGDFNGVVAERLKSAELIIRMFENGLLDQAELLSLTATDRETK